VKHSGASAETSVQFMQSFAVVLTAVFGCVVATGTMVVPGAVNAQKIFAVGTATLVTLLVAVVLGAELRTRR